MGWAMSSLSRAELLREASLRKSQGAGEAQGLYMARPQPPAATHLAHRTDLQLLAF